MSGDYVPTKAVFSRSAREVVREVPS